MTEKKTPKNAWKPGVSGNPAGKPAGTRNRATRLVIALMEDGAREITDMIISQAKSGDMAAARLVLERLAPPLRERPISIALPETTTPEGCAEAQNAILQAVGNGDLLPGEAATLAGIVENRRKAIETIDLEQRIAALEARK